MDTLALSHAPMDNTVAFAFMSISPLSSAQSYLVFAGVMLAFWLVTVIAFFAGLVKKND